MSSTAQHVAHCTACRALYSMSSTVQHVEHCTACRALYSLSHPDPLSNRYTLGHRRCVRGLTAVVIMSTVLTHSHAALCTNTLLLSKIDCQIPINPIQQPTSNGWGNTSYSFLSILRCNKNSDAWGQKSHWTITLSFQN